MSPDNRTSLSTRVMMIIAAVLCVLVSAIHVDDQGGVTALTDPDWLGWSYRLLEVGGLVIAGALVFAAGAAWNGARSKMLWVVSALIGAGPFLGYILSRTTGLPNSSDDIGDWSEQLGTVSLVVEGALVLLAIAALASLTARRGAPIPTSPQRHGVLVS